MNNYMKKNSQLKTVQLKELIKDRNTMITEMSIVIGQLLSTIDQRKQE